MSMPVISLGMAAKHCSPNSSGLLPERLPMDSSKGLEPMTMSSSLQEW